MIFLKEAGTKMINVMNENSRLLFKMPDDESLPKEKKIFTPTTWREAKHQNDLGHAIYWTVNEFNDGTRKKENLKRLISWAVEIDTGTKKDQSIAIQNYLEPSLVIESKRGFHVYYNCAPQTGTEFFKEIMEMHLLPCLDGDKRSKDVSKVLRAPCFWHLKNPNDPFFVKVVHTSKNVYTEKQMIEGFKPKSDRAAKEIFHKHALKKSLTNIGAGSIWENAYNMSSLDALTKISGTDCVNYETFEFKKTSHGRFNIFVNGNQTASFIDEHDRIGSSSGPSVASWINWYQNDWKKTAKYLKKYFPEIFEDKK